MELASFVVVVVVDGGDMGLKERFGKKGPQEVWEVRRARVTGLLVLRYLYLYLYVHTKQNYEIFHTTYSKLLQPLAREPTF